MTSYYTKFNTFHMKTFTTAESNNKGFVAVKRKRNPNVKRQEEWRNERASLTGLCVYVYLVTMKAAQRPFS